MISKLQDIQAAADTLSRQGTILYPTDTIWGLGCDATDAAAVEKIYRIKQRPERKSCIILVPDRRHLLQYIATPPLNLDEILDQYTVPTTFILNHAINLPDNLVNTDGSIAIRIPDDDFCKHLLRKFGKPIVSTSANTSGIPSPGNYASITDDIKRQVDYIVHHRRAETAQGKASKILKVLEDGTVRMIRD